MYSYRMYNKNFSKAEHIVNHRREVEALVPNGERRYVKRYRGRTKLATYLVERKENGELTWSLMANE